MKRFIISYSGGIGSFVAAHVMKNNGVTDSTIELVFTDTLIEDEDLYRFLDESAKVLELPLIKLADGRTPWEVFRDVKFQGNTRKAPCSRILKREVMAKYIIDRQQAAPEDEFVMVLGIDYEEAHRLKTAQKNNPHCQVIAPLCDPPLIPYDERKKIVESYGLALPRLYAMGFPHNNCGGFCVRAGLGQFELLKVNFPERFEMHKEAQKKLVADNPKLDKPFLRRWKDGKPIYISLETFDDQLKAEALSAEERRDIGGCGCFIDDDETVRKLNEA